jgi:hypothetical protein
VPPVSFSFFDPDQRSYRTLTEPAIPLSVRAGTVTTAPVAAAGAPDTAPRAAQDIVSIKQHLGTVAAIRAPLLQQGWFVALQSVPALALLGTVVWRKRKDSLANNPRLRRQRETARVIRDGLRDLHRFAAANQSDEFFATLVHLLQEQLGERLDLPASAITEAVVEERVRPGGVAESTVDSLRELFQACNFARYAPIKSSQELAAMIPKVEHVLGELKEVRL